MFDLYSRIVLRGQIKLTSSKVRLYFFKKNKGKGPDLLEFDFNVHDAFSWKKKGGGVRIMVFNATCKNISVIS